MNTIVRFLSQTADSFFLFGPRGTGKTTWLKMNYNKSIYIDFLSTRAYIEYSSDPERLKELVAGNSKIKTFILDEVQRIPEILTIVHQLIETNKDLQFVLTGSSARKLKRTGIDLLAGRALLKKCYPFMASELGDNFKLEMAIQYGMIPLIVMSPNPEKALHAYTLLYLREEIQSEGLIRNIGNFSRFLESISFSHGSVLNLSEIARDCMVERKTVDGYLSILEDLMISLRLPVFSKRAKRILISHSKFYFFDCGVFQSLRPRGPLDSPNEISGQALEGLVLQHLIAWNEYSGDKNQLFFWQTKSGVEVDFIVYGENNFWAIEVKNSKKIDLRELKGLISFGEDYPEAKLLYLYQGDEIMLKKNISCIPIEIFLKKLVPNGPVWEY